MHNVVRLPLSSRRVGLNKDQLVSELSSLLTNQLSANLNGQFDRLEQQVAMWRLMIDRLEGEVASHDSQPRDAWARCFDALGQEIEAARNMISIARGNLK